MADTNKKGLWLSSFQQGLAAERPPEYPGDGNIAFYFATDTGELSVAEFVADEGTATWVEVGSAGSAAIGALWSVALGTLVIPDIPTADPGVAGALWADTNIVTVSTGP